MLACLSRRRSWVQIPPGTLWHDAPIGRATKLKPWWLGVRIPLVLLTEAQWTSGHGRHALNVEVAGSNPAWATRRVGVHW